MSSTEIPQELIQQAKDGDRIALERLLVSYADSLSKHIARRLPTDVRSRISVEDVTQLAMTQAFLKIQHLRETTPKAFTAWLKAIGELTLMGMVKSERRQKRGGEFRRVGQVRSGDTGSLVDLIGELPGDASTASQRVARHEALAALQVSIASLDEDQRQAIQLNLIQGKSIEDTAAEMGRTPAAVRGLVYRAKQNLADAMGRASNWLSR